MALKLITAPVTEPVSLAEAKLHLRVDVDDDDALITSLIQAAREQAEHETGRALITQTWEAVYDEFPCDELFLGMPQVQSVSSVTYIDAEGDEQTLSSSAYSLDNETDKAFILPAIDTEWPDTLDTTNAVRVQFVCGYGSAGDVPAGIKTWMLMQIGALYCNREAVGKGDELRFVPRLLDKFKVY